MSNEGKALKEKLFHKNKNGWEKLSNEQLEEIFKFADEYMYYLNSSKTQKEIVQASKEVRRKKWICRYRRKGRIESRR